MGIPAGVSRVSLIGTGPGAEIFETGFWLQVAPATDALADALAADIVAAAGTVALPNLRSLIPADSSYRSVRVYSYPAGGPTAAHVGEAAIATGAGTATGSNPLQVAMVVTLLTGSAGRRNRGRMYLPATGVVMVDHMFSSARVDAAAQGVRDLLAGLGSETPPKPPVVVSTAGSSAKPITSVRADNKPDIQRRRANKLIETHSLTVVL